MKTAFKTKNMKIKLKYSVMQSDWNSFRGDVVLDSVNVAYRDEDSILDQIYLKQIFLDFYYEDF